MNAKEQTFGRAIMEARKNLGWSQKELASRVRREDDDGISPQYLNDIEHDRRKPSSDHMVQQFANVLAADVDWLYYLAGKFPSDVRERNLSEKDVKRAMVAFRKDVRR